MSKQDHLKCPKCGSDTFTRHIYEYVTMFGSYLSDNGESDEFGEYNDHGESKYLYHSCDGCETKYFHYGFSIKKLTKKKLKELG